MLNTALGPRSDRVTGQASGIRKTGAGPDCLVGGGSPRGGTDAWASDDTWVYRKLTLLSPSLRIALIFILYAWNGMAKMNPTQAERARVRRMA